MLNTLDEKMVIAIQTYFFNHNRELFSLDFDVPKNRRISKPAPNPNPKPPRRSMKQARQQLPYCT